MSERDQDAFEKYLEGKSELSRLYRDAPREEPSAQLDAAILAAARREAGSRPRFARSPFSRSWYVPVSIAAVIVVSVTLTLLVMEQEPSPVTPRLEFDKAVPAKTAPKAAEALPGARDAKTESKPGEEARKPVAPHALPEAGPVEPRAVPADKPASKLQALPAPKPGEALSAQPFPQKESGAISGGAGTLGAPASGSARDDAMQREFQKPEAAAPPAPAKQMAPAGPKERRTDEPAARMKSAVEKREAVKTQTGALPPEQWLKDIVELRRQGKVAEAEVSLAEFKKHYPDYPLPAELK